MRRCLSRVARSRLPRLCAGRPAPRSPRLSGAAAARERRQFFFRRASPPIPNVPESTHHAPPAELIGSARNRRATSASRCRADLYQPVRRQFGRHRVRRRASLDALLAEVRRRARAADAAPLIDGVARPRYRARRASRRSTARTIGEVAEGRRRDRRDGDGSGAAGLSRLGGDAASTTRAAVARTRRRSDRGEARPASSLCCRTKAGKTLDDALAELREAVDLCRYYAAQARGFALAPQAMPGPTGEEQYAALSRPRRLRLHQPVEFSAGDLPRPGRRRARRRQ